MSDHRSESPTDEAFDALHLDAPYLDDTAEPAPGVAIDFSVAHPVRRYDYWLGGKNNFEVDRISADAIASRFPTIRTATAENRAFLARAVRHLAGEAGIAQFLDIGIGLPAPGATHEVARRVNPDARVVYVDNDPVVLAHARALLTGPHARGASACLDGDLRAPEKILTDPVLTGTLDLSRPVAVLLVAVLHFLTDDEHPHAVVRILLDALCPGSYLAVSHATQDHLPDQALEDGAVVTARRQAGVWLRSRQDVGRFLAGLDLVPPGLVSTARWRADGEPSPRPSEADVATVCAVGRVPAPR